MNSCGKVKGGCKMISDHEFLRKLTLEVVLTSTGATFFLGTSLMSILVLLFVVSMRFLRTSSFLSYLEERRNWANCFFIACCPIRYFYFYFKWRLASPIDWRVYSYYAKLLLYMSWIDGKIPIWSLGLDLLIGGWGWLRFLFFTNVWRNRWDGIDAWWRWPSRESIYRY